MTENKNEDSTVDNNDDSTVDNNDDSAVDNDDSTVDKTVNNTDSITEDNEPSARSTTSHADNTNYEAEMLMLMRVVTAMSTLTALITIVSL